MYCLLHIFVVCHLGTTRASLRGKITPCPSLRASCLLRGELRKAFFLADVVDDLQHPLTVRVVLYTEFRDQPGIVD
jgi:hypothetical protein